MALSKQALEIPLGQGLQTDVDPKLLPVGKSTTLENCEWTESGEVIKRPGSLAFGNNYVTSGSPAAMPVPWQLAQHKGSLVELAQAGVRPIGAYSPGMDKWMTCPVDASDGANGLASKLRGPLVATRQPVFRVNTTAGAATSSGQSNIASDGTLVLEAWIQLNPAGGPVMSVTARVLELSTGNVLFTYVIASGTAFTSPGCVYTNGVFTLVYHDANANLIREVHWSTAALLSGTAAASSPVTLATGIILNDLDAVAQGNNVAILYGAPASPSGKTMMTVYPAGSPGSAATTEIVDSLSARIPTGTAVWVSDLGGSGRIDFVTANVNGLWYYLGVAPGGTTTGEFLVDGTSFPAGIWAMAAHTISAAASGEFSIVYQTAGQPAPLKLGYRVVGHGVSAVTWLNSTSVMSKTFSHNGDFYVLIAYESVLQGAYFAIRVPAHPYDSTDYTQAPSARYATNAGAGSDGSLTNVIPISANQLIAAAVVRTRLNELPNASHQYDLGVDLVTLAFNPAVSNAREYADSLYVCGGILGQFDGAVFAEEGFHVYPEAPVVNQTAGGSMTALGTYEVCQVYRYTDANGRLHRSKPSDPTSVTLTAGNLGISVVGKTLKLTGRPGANAIETYLALPSQPAQFNLIDVSRNDETTDTHTVAYSLADTVDNGEELYADGGVIGNGPPPAAKFIALFNGRLAVVDPDDPTLVRISMPLSDTQGPSFDFEEVSSVRIADSHGDITGLGAMDDKLLIFKADAAYMVNGTGPDVTGNGTWGVPQFVCIGTGCTNVRSIAEVPDGVVFQSTSTKAGTYLINRGLGLSYIGAPVQAYLADPIVDVVHVPARSRTMFYTSAGRTQVYDWSQSKLANGQNIWTTNVNQAAACAGLLNGVPVYQQAGQTALSLLREDTAGTVWDENGTPNDEYVVTPWLSLNGLKGYERFYQLQGVGKTVSPHFLTVTMWVNFNDSAPFSTTSIQIGGTGPTTDWGAWEFKHPNKSTSVRFGIRCARTPGDHSDGAAANMSAIVIIYGTKTGLRKIAGTNRTT